MTYAKGTIDINHIEYKLIYSATIISKCLDIWYEASSSGPKSMPLGKNRPALEVTCFTLIDVYSENIDKIFSETTRPRDLIFDI